MKSGYVAIVGLPNTGKSTLLNVLTGVKLSPVSPKPQTTRQRVVGIVNSPDHQILFLDTPGILEPRYELQRFMKQEIARAQADADVVLLVVEPAVPNLHSGPLETVLDRRRTVVAINKIDRIPESELPPVVEHYTRSGCSSVVPISALKQSGIEELRNALLTLLPNGMPYYPQDQMTTQPERFFVGELLREAVFMSYGEEIPYATIVEIAEFREQPGRKTLIRATVYVERESQKGILIGRQGRALKRLGSRARREVEIFLGQPVYLELTVETRPGWRRDQAFIRERFQDN